MNASITRFKSELKTNQRTYRALLRGDDKATLRYLAEASEAIAANPDLLDAHRPSLHAAIGTAASMGLSILPVLGEAWLIPRRRNVGTYEQPRWVEWVNFQIGYKGLIKLAHRSNLVDSVFVEVAYRGEPYVYRGGTNPGIEHEPVEEFRTRAWDDIVAAYAVVFLKGSSRPTFEAVSRKELSDVRSSTGSKYKECADTWRDHPEAMARKTALIRVAKLLPREDKLREFHVAVGHELALEGGQVSQIVTDEDFMLDTARPSLAERAMPSEPREPRRWTEAVKHWRRLSVTDDELLGFLEVEEPGQIDDDGYRRLETLFGEITTRATTVEAVFRPHEADDVPEETDDEGPEVPDEDLPF